MKTTLYSLKKKRDTSEYHIFEAHKNDALQCIPAKESICKKMDKNENPTNVVECLPADAMRKKAADIGRPVCGTCVSHLYESY